MGAEAMRMKFLVVVVAALVAFSLAENFAEELPACFYFDSDKQDAVISNQCFFPGYEGTKECTGSSKERKRVISKSYWHHFGSFFSGHNISLFTFLDRGIAEDSLLYVLELCRGPPAFLA